eukprot:SAG11_NODE_343_length_10455_cov_7.072036_2_plen_150_part_00
MEVLYTTRAGQARDLCAGDWANAISTGFRLKDVQGGVAAPDVFVGSSADIRRIEDYDELVRPASNAITSPHAFFSGTDLILVPQVVVSGDGLVYEVYQGLMGRADWRDAVLMPVAGPCSGHANCLLHKKKRKNRKNRTVEHTHSICGLH